MGEIIKFLIYAISMCAIELVINSLYNRKSITDNAGRNEFHYVLKIPGALKYTCMAFFILGLCQEDRLPLPPNTSIGVRLLQLDYSVV